MNRQKLINLNRITCVTIATKEDAIYLVFQDGRHNYGYKVKDMEYAQNALKTIEKGVQWWRVLGEPVEVTFKKKGIGDKIDLVMENFEFKSQICTTKEQSEKLLALGLKKETADFGHCSYGGTYIVPKYPNIHNWDNDIPAWSLHRLIEMIPLDIWHTEYENGPRLKHTFWFCKHAPSYNSVENIDFREHPNLYDNIIDCIEWLINEGYFNKDYLEEKK